MDDDSSWPIQNSSLVYLGMEIRSLPFIARPPPIRVGNLLRLLEEFLSTPSPPASLWHRLLGHLSSLTFLVPDGMLRMRLLQPCLKDQWDFLDDQFQVSWSPLCREYLLWWTRVAQLREGVSFSLPVPDVSLLSDASDVGPHRRTPLLGPLVSSSEDTLHQPERASSSSVRPEGLRTPVGGPFGSSVLRRHHYSSVCPSPAAIHHGLVQCHSGRSVAPYGDRAGMDPSSGGSRSTGPQMASGDQSF